MLFDPIKILELYAVIDFTLCSADSILASNDWIENIAWPLRVHTMSTSCGEVMQVYRHLPQLSDGIV
jgi:hypothetical protein